MGKTWFRLYDEVVDDPKVQLLPDHLFKAWINCMCLASNNVKCRGSLPDLQAVAYRLHMLCAEAERLIADLVDAGLFDWRNAIAYAHNWNHRQFDSDSSTKRVQLFRQRHQNETLRASDTAQETFHVTKEEKKESIKERKEEIVSQIQSTDTEVYTDTDTEGERGRAADAASVGVHNKNQFTSYGEFQHVRLRSEDFADLESRLGYRLAELIIELDLYGETHPEKFRKYKNHKAVLISWAGRRQKENAHGERRQNYETRGEYTARKNEEAGAEARRQLLHDATRDGVWPDSRVGADQSLRKGFKRSN